jgi:hypothetical protein
MHAHSHHPARATKPASEDWVSTREMSQFPTQIMQTKEDYLGLAARDIGRRVNEQQHELFVVCDPADALQQHFDLLTPDFIVIHDLGSSSSRRLVAGVAAGTGRKLQQLVIRRQGFGVVLATLEFAELPSANGQTLRVYTTHSDADPMVRQQLSRVLLGYSRLGVVFVGDVTPNVLAESMRSLKDAIANGPWKNRHLLLVPTAPAGALSAEASQLAGRSGVEVRTTPPVKRPTDGWGFIVEAWERLRDTMQLGGGKVASPTSASGNPRLETRPEPAPAQRGQAAPAPRRADPPSVASTPASRAAPPRARYEAPARQERQDDDRPDFEPTTEAAFGMVGGMAGGNDRQGFGSAPTAPLPFRPMPEVRRPDAAAPPPASPLAAFAQRCMAIHGVLGCCLFDIASRRSLIHSGSPGSATLLAMQGEAMLSAIVSAAATLGIESRQPEIAISFPAQHLILRVIPSQPGIALLVVLDRQRSNLLSAREQIMRLDAPTQL